MKEETNSNKQKNNRVLYSIIIIIASLCVILGVSLAGVSLAIFQYNRTGEEPNEVTTGTLILTLDDSMGSGINVENAMPTSDEVGKTSTPYEFTLENVGTLTSNYRIRVVNDEEAIQEDGCSSNLLDYSQIRYLFTSNGSDGAIQYLSDLNNGQLEKRIEYSLRLWLDSSITNPNEVNGKHLHVKIMVEAIQGSNVEFDDYVKENMLVWLDGSNHGADPNSWLDLSGYGNNGILHNVDHTTTSGWKDTYLQCDGIDDYIEVRPTLYLGEDHTAYYDSLTFELVIQLEETDLGSFEPEKTISWTQGADTLVLYGREAAYIQDVNGNAVYVPGVAKYDLNLTTLSVVYDRSSNLAYYYQDGTLTKTQDISNIPGQFRIGAQHVFTHAQLLENHNPKGKIFAVRFYDRALNEAEIHQNYAMDISKYS